MYKWQYYQICVRDGSSPLVVLLYLFTILRIYRDGDGDGDVVFLKRLRHEFRHLQKFLR